MECTEVAELLAKAAANALGGIDSNTGLGLADRGAADLHAHTAVAALGSIANERNAGLLDDQRAGTARDDDGELIAFGLLTDNFLEFFEVERIDYADVLDAHCVAKLEDIKSNSGIAVDVFAVCGVILVTGHAGDGVIRNNDGTDGAVVGHVQKAGEAAVAEC